MEKDITTNTLLSNNDVFADIANVNLFGGEQIIMPEDLEEVALEFSYKDLEGKHHKLFRDTLKKVKKLGGCIAFLGFENQVDINRVMPVRDMGYTYAGYAKQIKEIVAQNRKEENSAYTKVLHENQKLMPIATFVLYFGQEEWTEPLSLMDILDIPESEKYFWKALICDYSIRVIHMIGQSEEIRKCYQSDYGVIADYLSSYKNEEQMRDYLRYDKRKLIHVEEVLDMLQSFTGDKRFDIMKEKYESYDKKDEVNCMCMLMDMVFDESRELGIAEGMRKKSIMVAKNLIGMLDIPRIAETTGLSVQEVEELARSNS